MIIVECILDVLTRFFNYIYTRAYISLDGIVADTLKAKILTKIYNVFANLWARTHSWYVYICVKQGHYENED